MNITSPVFQAYLECPTNCFLRAHGEVGTGNEYANWVRTESEAQIWTDAGDRAGCVLNTWTA